MLTLRRVEEQDIPKLKAIKEHAFEEEFHRLGFTSEEMISIEWHKSMMRKSIYYVILKDKQIIGGVNIFKGNAEYYLCSLFIDLPMQNFGLGSQVLTQLETLHNDGKKWGLETPSTSVRNHHFYEKFGYKHVRDMTPNGAPKGFALRVYEKIIQ